MATDNEVVSNRSALAGVQC